MTNDSEIVEPAAVTPAEQPHESPVEPVEPLAAPPPAGPPSWYMQTINAERERTAAAERRAAEAEALAGRLAAKPPEGQTAPLTASVNETQRQAEIQAAARQQRFYEDTVEVRQQGIAQYGAGFAETLNILGALGATGDEFIADVLAIDKPKAHEVLAMLAKDPEKAVSLTQMNSRQRIAELTRMTMTQAASGVPAAPAPVAAGAPPRMTSKAPAPAPIVTPSTTTVKDWRTDDASDEEFDAGFKEMMERRSARR